MNKLLAVLYTALLCLPLSSQASEYTSQADTAKAKAPHISVVEKPSSSTQKIESASPQATDTDKSAIKTQHEAATSSTADKAPVIKKPLVQVQVTQTAVTETPKQPPQQAHQQPPALPKVLASTQSKAPEQDPKQVPARETIPYFSVYQAELKGFKVKMRRSLKLTDGVVSVRMKARKLMFGLEEHTRYTNENGQIKTLTYGHKRKNLGDRHDRDLVFDWTAKIVTDTLRPEQEDLKIEGRLFDKVSYQEQFRLDLQATPDKQRFEYPLTDGKSIKLYAFEKIGEEQISTPLGKLNTVKFKRDRGTSSSRETYIWFATDWSYLLVRLDQVETAGAKPERMELLSAEIGGQKITGLPSPL